MQPLQEIAGLIKVHLIDRRFKAALLKLLFKTQLRAFHPAPRSDSPENNPHPDSGNTPTHPATQRRGIGPVEPTQSPEIPYRR
jgi:hypothetical protein